MILTVTPNAALDRTLVAPGYGGGGVFRPQQVVVAPGGKGINVARAARVLGGSARCCGFLAGYTGELLASLAAREGLDSHWTVLAEGETRVCTILVDPALEQTSVINESGVQTTDDDWDKLGTDILTAAQDADAVCISGSIPPGTSPGSFLTLLTNLQRMSKSVWVDTSGAWLKTAATVTGVHLKVNDDEAGELLGIAISDLAEAGAAALTLAKRSVVSAVITLGKRGAVMSDGESVWHAQPPTIAAKSAVASGDCFLAGLLVSLSQGLSEPEALRRAAAAGAANAMSVGGGQFSMTDFEQILTNTTIIKLNAR